MVPEWVRRRVGEAITVALLTALAVSSVIAFAAWARYP